jgi:hypothetical protein
MLCLKKMNKYSFKVKGKGDEILQRKSALPLMKSERNTHTFTGIPRIVFFNYEADGRKFSQ